MKFKENDIVLDNNGDIGIVKYYDDAISEGPYCFWITGDHSGMNLWQRHEKLQLMCSFNKDIIKLVI